MSSFKGDFNKFSHKYKNFQNPNFEIRVQNKNLSKNNKIILRWVNVDLTSEYKSSFASFGIEGLGNYFEPTIFESLLKSDLKLGNKVEISLGYGSNLKKVFVGYIMAARINDFKDSSVELVIECYDATNIMMFSKKTLKYEDCKSYSDAVLNVLKKYVSVISSKDVSSSFKVSGDIVQNNQSDYEFIKKMGQAIGYEFFIELGKAYFRPIASKARNCISISSSGMLIDYSQEINLTNQLMEVAVKAHHSGDPDRDIIKSVKKVETVGKGRSQASDVSSLIGKNNVLEYYLPSIENMDEAGKLAEAKLFQNSLNFIQAKMQIIGVPEVFSGKYITVKTKFFKKEKQFYITSVNHKIDAGGYRTEIRAKANKL